jgi:hypothetical protein
VIAAVIRQRLRWDAGGYIVAQVSDFGDSAGQVKSGPLSSFCHRLILPDGLKSFRID